MQWIMKEHVHVVRSMNYSVKEYANNVVYILAETCQQHNLPHPEIITESGRALTAHHMLITNVIRRNRHDLTNCKPAVDGMRQSSKFMGRLYHLSENNASDLS